jgi:hypothetical protein
MNKEKNKSNDHFSSVEEWQRKYFPEVINQERLNKLRENPEALGKALAEETLKQVKAQLLNH